MNQHELVKDYLEKQKSIDPNSPKTSGEISSSLDIPLETVKLIIKDLINQLLKKPDPFGSRTLEQISRETNISLEDIGLVLDDEENHGNYRWVFRDDKKYGVIYLAS